ncbi:MULTISPECIES: Uma2 family endonuclease [unclassified Microcystis]|jgi:Uma2 family endonuclease|uniref:Uma2 family endonuclease n=1 Tax=unclassified Microcystis TaxID=2643300 RepID=UPI0025882C5C|nr:MULTISPECIES: Uma2 family endonuclease [unclassified Microcystis]MCA2761807.1 Uma2 family endonuclease [Microcystis sp. M151S2]MCA2641666.1 Uma2 family endonuclease [Microcystis sp. M087S2]MCA2671412.1 Uma2 family endonuclease [Microcystis sp. M080S2]MCA2687701.1 Uma2 family endonuclease [Microcystis sp. M037S2]MCA2735540.1 Uma2 family endonuclease [Microcystis sp. M158S2]
MTYLSPKLFTFEDFLNQYGDDPRYQLIDAELRDMEPTGPQESVAGKIAGRLWGEIFRLHLPWTIPKNCLLRPESGQATALRPDVIILDEVDFSTEPLWEKQAILTSSPAIKLVVEVVSSNWQDDYARKVEEYSSLGIAEYWIVDFRGLGGISFIGKPKQPTLTIYQLEGDEYQQKLYRLYERISSAVFPELSLCLLDIIP